jgi:hypothetical protein
MRAEEPGKTVPATQVGSLAWLASHVVGAPPANGSDADADSDARVEAAAVPVPSTSSAPDRATPSGPGQALPRDELHQWSTLFGHDFRDVRLHTGGAAADLARAHGALAYTRGSDIVLGETYAPGARSGKALLAHELTHVVQQYPGRQAQASGGIQDAALEAQADQAADRVLRGLAPGPMATAFRVAQQHKPDPAVPATDDLQVESVAGLSWWSFTPVGGAAYGPGDKDTQLSGLVLKGLLGPAYTTAVRDEVLRTMSPPIRWQPPILAKAGDPMEGALVHPKIVRRMLDAAAKAGALVTLTPERERYLSLGITTQNSYGELRRQLGADWPDWFSYELFGAMASSRAALVTEVGAGTKEVTDLGAEIMTVVQTVEAIRADAALTGHRGYQYLWPPVPGSATGSVAARDRVPRLEPAAGLLDYVAARPRAAREAVSSTGAAARKALLDGFVAAFDERQLQPTAKGDQPLSEVPTHFTAPPYPSTLTVYPPLDLGLYGSTVADYGFEMSLQFPNIFAAFQFHQYEFTAFKVPDDSFVGAKPAPKTAGRAASHWDVLKGRLARDARYQEADVRAYGNSLWTSFGAPGVAVEPASINALLRYAGTLIGSLLEALFDPSYVARFRFPDEGLYLVRAVAHWDSGGREIALKRPPSVAYQLLFARSPELLAEQHLQAVVAEQEEATKRIAAIDTELRTTKDAGHREALQRERDQLAAGTGGVEAMLAYQKAQFDKSTDPAAASRATDLQHIMDTRRKRGFDANTERLPASYVNDRGQVIDLLLEVKVTGQGDPAVDYADYQVNDATTPSSVASSVHRGSRHDAILAGIKEILADSDYGRGRAVVLLDGTYENIPVATVSAGKMFMEALANTATILSLVALALAIPTGGESMVLMMPAMAIGAVPSAYNIVKRGLRDKTLHADLALAMDIVNVVGAAVGVGAETRAGMQAIRLGTAGGKVLIVLGLGTAGAGVLVMSASVLAELDAVRNLPPGLQQAEVMRILSRAMFQAGMMIGQVLAAQLRAGHGVEARPFEDWLASLDEQSRAAIEKSRTDAHTTTSLWRAWAEMDPLVRELLTQCGSECVPGTPPSKADQQRLKKLATGLSEQATRTLKGLLHDNREPAAFGKLLSDLESARSAAPPSKGTAKKIAATEKAILDRGTVAQDLLANFSEEGVNQRAGGTPDPDRWKRVVALADEVGKAGTIPLDVLRLVLDRLRLIQGSNPEAILLLLRRLAEIYGKVPGAEKLLGTRGLVGSYTDFEGARWTMQFLEDNGLWSRVTAFEDPAPVPGMDRWIDIRLDNGTRIELKSWEKWHHWANASFSRQIMADYLGTMGFTAEPVAWVFEPGGTGGVQSPRALLGKMNAALDQALAEKWPGYDDAGAAARVAAIKKALPRIVKVGTL